MIRHGVNFCRCGVNPSCGVKFSHDHGVNFYARFAVRFSALFFCVSSAFVFRGSFIIRFLYRLQNA